MAEPFVGGFLPPPSPGPPPPLPPKDQAWSRLDGRVPSNASWSEASRTESTLSGASNQTYSRLSNMNAVERSKQLRVARMSPYLQFMAGPLLRYDTVDERGVWRGAVLIVSESSSSSLSLSAVWVLRAARRIAMWQLQLLVLRPRLQLPTRARCTSRCRRSATTGTPTTPRPEDSSGIRRRAHTGSRLISRHTRLTRCPPSRLGP